MYSSFCHFLLNKSLDDHIDKYSPLFLLINRSRKNNQSLSENSLKLSSKNFEKNVSISIFPFINDEAKVVIQINVNKTNEKFYFYINRSNIHHKLWFQSRRSFKT